MTQNESIDWPKCDAWLHELIDAEGLRVSVIASLSWMNPFGVAGDDYDDSYSVQSLPLDIRQ